MSTRATDDLSARFEVDRGSWKGIRTKGTNPSLSTTSLNKTSLNKTSLNKTSLNQSFMNKSLMGTSTMDLVVYDGKVPTTVCQNGKPMVRSVGVSEAT